MLEDSTISHIVSWSSTLDSFLVKDMNEFSRQVLPGAFKHNNFTSFVRQLNKYGFRKVRSNSNVKGLGVDQVRFSLTHARLPPVLTKISRSGSSGTFCLSTTISRTSAASDEMLPLHREARPGTISKQKTKMCPRPRLC